MEIDFSEMVSKIQEQSYSAFSLLSDQICNDPLADQNEVEKMLDSLLGYCYDDRILDLYKKVCKTFYSKYPNMIAEHILMYKDMYEHSN